MKEAGIVFERTTLKDKSFQDIVSIVDKLSEGRVWIIGGTVYRNIAHAWYGLEAGKKDFDFIVERLSNVEALPGWQITTTRFGSPRMKSRELSIDIIPLQDVVNIKKKNLPVTIDSYINTTPLTIQSIAYDLSKKELIGDVGINALKTRTVGVHDYEIAKSYADQLGITVNDLVLEKANSLGFTPLLLDR